MQYPVDNKTDGFLRGMVTYGAMAILMLGVGAVMSGSTFAWAMTFVAAASSYINYTCCVAHSLGHSWGTIKPHHIDKAITVTAAITWVSCAIAFVAIIAV